MASSNFQILFFSVFSLMYLNILAVNNFAIIMIHLNLEGASPFYSNLRIILLKFRMIKDRGMGKGNH